MGLYVQVGRCACTHLVICEYVGCEAGKIGLESNVSNEPFEKAAFGS